MHYAIFIAWIYMWIFTIYMAIFIGKYIGIARYEGRKNDMSFIGSKCVHGHIIFPRCCIRVIWDFD